MPRRALVFITALVLAAHWAVLHGVPLAWEPPPPPPTPVVFSTRSIAAAPPAPAAAPPAAAPRPAPASKPPPARPRPAKPAPTPAPPPVRAPENDTLVAAADAVPAATPSPNSEPVPDAAATGDVAAEASADTALADAPAAVPPPMPAASAPEPAPPPPTSVPASSPAAAVPGSGVDIVAPPGSGAAQPPATAHPPVKLPPPTRLAFDVSGQARKFGYNARAELLWHHDGSRYEARQEISAFLLGSRAQRSTGAVTLQGLQPERFSDRSRSEQAAHFDYQRGRVTFSANTPEVAAGPGVQDRLSVFIQLGALLAADPERFVPGTQITLATVSARSADRWTFTIEGPETLDLPLGPTEALKLERLPRKDYDQKAELWVAPSLGYLPVRIRITQANGDFADLRLRERDGAP